MIIALFVIARSGMSGAARSGPAYCPLGSSSKRLQTKGALGYNLTVSSLSFPPFLRLVLLFGLFAGLTRAGTETASQDKTSKRAGPSVSAPGPEDVEDYFRKWLNEDVVHIVSEEESKVFQNLSTPEEKEAVHRAVLVSERSGSPQCRQRVQRRTLSPDRLCQRKVLQWASWMVNRSGPHLYHSRSPGADRIPPQRRKL